MFLRSHGQIESAIDPDQEYILFIWSETLPSACYILFNELYLTSTLIFTTSNRYTNIVHLREKLERKCVSWYLGPRDKAALNRAIEELKDKLQQDSFQIFLEELEPW